MSDLTILYYTDNSLDQNLFELCQHWLLKNSGDNEIISVSQKPINFGKNICIGKIGQSWISLWEQQVMGLKAVTTKYVAFAEHDVLYNPDHFSFTPSTENTFYYNNNFWYMHVGKKRSVGLYGTFSYASHRKYGEFKIPQSQLIAGRDIALQAYSERYELLKNKKISSFLPAEPGMMKNKSLEVLKIENIPELTTWAEKWNAELFSTQYCNLDIQHDSNYSMYSRARRGGKIRTTLPYWGKFHNILGA